MSDIDTLDNATITAVATAPGRGGIGIIRLSGGNAKTIAEQITQQPLSPRHAHFSAFHDQQHRVLDTGIALLFPGPRSFTGEDVVELQAHGGPVILDLIQRECLALGARPARPGEFSERAYLNGKLDLAQAEAIADLINSTTELAARNASRSLQGAFSAAVETLVGSVTRLRVYVEAAIDFPEEEIDFIQDGQVREQLEELIAQLADTQQQARQGRLLQEGMKLVIAGRPNAGKSSLLNALSGQETAIVTAAAGTTRDVLREHIQMDGMPLHIVDTAGLRESDDEVEREGIRRARLEIDSADQILLVMDAQQTNSAAEESAIIWPQQAPPKDRQPPVTRIINKCDLTAHEAGIEQNNGRTTIYLSAKQGQGISLLRDHLKACMGYQPGGESSFSARRRHLQSLEDAGAWLQAGKQQLSGAGAAELLAEDLKQCQQSLGEITGTFTSDQLLGEIFSSFCIGK